MKTAILLHNIRSAHNVGSIFRTADAAGVRTMYLSGYTPLPRDRFGRTQRDIAKTALGAEQVVAWKKVGTVSRWLREMKRGGWRVVGVEQDERARDYRALGPQQKTLFVFGNEVRGLSRALRDQCDVIIEIPMRGSKESLNVAVAAGVVLFAAAH